MNDDIALQPPVVQPDPPPFVPAIPASPVSSAPIGTETRDASVWALTLAALVIAAHLAFILHFSEAAIYQPRRQRLLGPGDESRPHRPHLVSAGKRRAVRRHALAADRRRALFQPLSARDGRFDRRPTLLIDKGAHAAVPVPIRSLRSLTLLGISAAAAPLPQRLGQLCRAAAAGDQSGFQSARAI